jgi:curved DNA-binding protein CbpA
MAIKRTLYQILQVTPDADATLVRAAFEARLKKLEGSTTVEDAAERTLLREAYEVLSDPVRRKLYDERLLEELRAARSGGGSQVQPKPRAPWIREAWEESSSSAFRWMAGIALLVVAGTLSGWVYLDHARKVRDRDLEAARRAEESRLRRELVERRVETSNWAKDRADLQRRIAEDRYREYERQRDRAAAERQRQVELAEQRKYEAEERRAEQERQRKEAEIMRRAREDLERDKRLLQQLEREHPRRF